MEYDHNIHNCVTAFISSQNVSLLFLASIYGYRNKCTSIHMSKTAKDFVGVMNECVFGIAILLHIDKESQSYLQVSSNPVVISTTQLCSHYLAYFAFFLSSHHTFTHKTALNFTHISFVGVWLFLWRHAAYNSRCEHRNWTSKSVTPTSA